MGVQSALELMFNSNRLAADSSSSWITVGKQDEPPGSNSEAADRLCRQPRRLMFRGREKIKGNTTNSIQFQTHLDSKPMIRRGTVALLY